VKKLALLLPLLPVVALAAGKKDAPPVNQSTPTQVPLSGLYLRNTFDTDPTEYIGGFVMNPEGVPDDAAASKLACSTFVSYKEVGGGGVTTTDFFTASQGAALKLGVPPVASGQAGFDRGVTLLVQYTATKKWQAVVDDPGGFANCCATYPDQCRKQYVGEFLAGTGKIYSEIQAKGGAKAGAVARGVAGQVMAYAGKQWSYTNEFPNEVAFAFKLKDAPVANAAAFKDPICASDWQSQVPNDPRGHWERAVSDVMPDEAGAQSNAWDHAALQMAKWCGVDVSLGTTGGRTDVSDGGSTSTRMGASTEFSLAAQALVSRMRLVCSSQEKAEAPRGYQYKLTGLYLLPQSEVTSSCAALKAAIPGVVTP